ncbi:MAG: hypothetical protein LUG61_04900 [Lachnospiraceae bacterium]|nr:hypothetical protein [Lachnospiraceae bacterium]
MKNTDYIDMWYGDKVENATKIDICFSDCDAQYRGNIYINDKAVGDYQTADSLKIEHWFPQLKICWD